jgi:Pyrroline-5-carboxylate reductase
MTISLGVIGGGNMAQAIIAGVQRTAPDLVNAVVAEPNAETRNTLSTMGINTVNSAREVMATNDYIMLAVKPQSCQRCAKTLHPNSGPINASSVLQPASPSNRFEARSATFQIL